MFQNGLYRYYKWRDNSPYIIHVFLAAIEILLFGAWVIAGGLLCLSPIFIAAHLGGPGAALAAIGFYVLLLASAGLVNDRRRGLPRYW